MSENEKPVKPHYDDYLVICADHKIEPVMSREDWNHPLMGANYEKGEYLRHADGR